MTGPVLVDARPRLGERSAVLGVTLGIMSALRRARSLLRRYGAPAAAEAPPAPDDAPMLLFCLGVIAVSRTLMTLRRRALGAAAPARPSSSSAEAPAAVWTPRELGQ